MEPWGDARTGDSLREHFRQWLTFGSYYGSPQERMVMVEPLVKALLDCVQLERSGGSTAAAADRVRAAALQVLHAGLNQRAGGVEMRLGRETRGGGLFALSSTPRAHFVFGRLGELEVFHELVTLASGVDTGVRIDETPTRERVRTVMRAVNSSCPADRRVAVCEDCRVVFRPARKRFAAKCPRCEHFPRPRHDASAGRTTLAVESFDEPGNRIGWRTVTFARCAACGNWFRTSDRKQLFGSPGCRKRFDRQKSDVAQVRTGVGYTLRAAYECDYGGGVIAVGPEGTSFDVKAALDAGGGTIVVADSDHALQDALDVYPPLERVPRRVRLRRPVQICAPVVRQSTPANGAPIRLEVPGKTPL